MDQRRGRPRRRGGNPAWLLARPTGRWNSAWCIGQGGRYIPESEALSHVAGYCVVNDVSEREFQIERSGTWDKGKGCDTFGPIGPWLVTADEVPDPQALGMWLEVDGKRFQNGNTSTMVVPGGVFGELPQSLHEFAKRRRHFHWHAAGCGHGAKAANVSARRPDHAPGHRRPGHRKPKPRYRPEPWQKSPRCARWMCAFRPRSTSTARTP